MDIGSLTGRIALEDQLTGKLTTVLFQVQKFAEDFDGALGAVAIGVGATATALAGLTAGIVALGVKGSTILGVEEAFNRLAEASGSTGEALITGLDAGLRGTVDSMEQMQAVSRAMTAGVRLSADEMELLGDAARAIGKATGTDATQGLERLSTALATGQTRTLRMAGLVVDLSQAESRYADVHGLVASQLTTTQQLEAKRAAILDATRGYVDRLGESEISFKERLQQTTVAIGNWFDNLSKAVAQSTHVTAAMDAIRDAIQRSFGGSSQELLDWTIKWVNRFADAVATYGPPVIEAFGWIYKRVRDIWNAVMDAWNLVPDWLKNIVRDAALTTAALYITTKAVSGLASSFLDLTKMGSGGGGKGGLTLANDIATITDASISLGRLFNDVLPNAISNTVKKFAEMRLALNAVAAGMSSTLLLAAGIPIILMSAQKVIEAGVQAWNLWKESAERAASATKQLTNDQANLQRLNESMGTSFKDVNEAAAAYRDFLAEFPPVIEHLSEKELAAAEAAKFHAEQVDKLYQTIAGAAAQVDVTSEAFEKLSLVQKNSVEAQKLLIPMLDARIEKGKALTVAEKAYYETVVTSRLNLEAHNVAALAAQEVSLARIQSMRAMGMAETEIAQALGTTVVALKQYSAHLLSLKTLTQELNDVRLAMTGTATDVAVAGYQREYEAAVEALDQTSIYYAETMTKLAALRDARVDAEGSSWSQLSSQSQEALMQMAEAARRDYNRMLQSGLHFSREVLDEQLRKTRELEFSAHHMGQSYADATKAVSTGTIAAINEMTRLAAATWEAKRAADALVSFSFDLDPSDPRYVPPGAHRAPTPDNIFAWEWDDPTKRPGATAGQPAEPVLPVVPAAQELVPASAAVMGGMVNYIYVNDTLENAANKVADKIMQKATLSKKFTRFG